MTECEEILADGMVLSTVWGKTIVMAETMGHFLPHQRRDATQWHLCAVRELDNGKSIAVACDGATMAPADDRLCGLGQDFCLDVQNDDFKGAARTLVSISKRIKALEAWGVAPPTTETIRGDKR